MSLTQIANKPLRDRVLDALRDAIINGDLKPGQQLIETDLAAQLGVSRAPLREALQILKSEGLVEIVPYHGAIVRKLSKTDIEELYSLRVLLETFAARRIIDSGEQAQAAEHLTAIYEAMRQAAAIGEMSAVSAHDRQFHDTLIERSGHSLLMSMWSMVSMRVRQVMALRNRRNSDPMQIAQNHLPIIQAIAAGDEARATELIRQHAASAADLIIDGWVYAEDDR